MFGAKREIFPIRPNSATALSTDTGSRGYQFKTRVAVRKDDTATYRPIDENRVV